MFQVLQMYISYQCISCLGKTLILKEKAIRLAKQRHEAMEEYISESNELKQGNAESKEENLFLSGFGEIHSDTDDYIDIDSNTEEQSIITKESAIKQKQNYATDDETHNIKGKVIIHEFIEKYFKKIS